MLSAITRLGEEERCGRVDVDEIRPAADFLTRRSEVHPQSTRPRTRQPPPLHRTTYPQRDSPSTVDSLSPARPRRPSMRRRIRPARRRSVSRSALRAPQDARGARRCALHRARARAGIALANERMTPLFR